MSRDDARVNAAARTELERAAFHLFLTHPSTSARLDALLEENRRLDEAAAATVVVEVELVPVSMDTAGVVDVALVPKSSSTLATLTKSSIVNNPDGGK